MRFDGIGKSVCRQPGWRKKEKLMCTFSIPIPFSLACITYLLTWEEEKGKIVQITAPPRPLFSSNSQRQNDGTNSVD